MYRISFEMVLADTLWYGRPWRKVQGVTDMGALPPEFMFGMFLAMRASSDRDQDNRMHADLAPGTDFYGE